MQGSVVEFRAPQTPGPSGWLAGLDASGLDRIASPVPPQVTGVRNAPSFRLTAVREVAGRRTSEAASPRMADLERALLNPAAVFASPEAVLAHPLLSVFSKREILRRWAWDEYLLERAEDDGMPDGPPSRLAEVTAVLIQLGDDWHPHPAAPAAFAFVYDQDEALSLAA